MYDAMTKNYSGRGGITPTYENVLEQIKKSHVNIEHVNTYHNSKDIVRQLICLLS